MKIISCNFLNQKNCSHVLKFFLDISKNSLKKSNFFKDFPHFIQLNYFLLLINVLKILSNFLQNQI